MIITTIDDFVKYVTTAAGSKFDTLSPYIEREELEAITNLLGVDLYNYIEAKDDNNVLKRTLKRMIAFGAYATAIPLLDVVQTDNGFAVVSNSNLAPASKERVERLIKISEDSSDESEDMLVRLIFTDAAALTEWRKFAGFEELTNCLFVSGYEFDKYCELPESEETKEPDRCVFEDNKNQLISWQTNVIAKSISAAYLDQLLGEIRANTFTPGAVRIINLCKGVLGRLYAKDERGARKQLETIENILDADLATYSTYAGSAERALKVSANYVNKKEDSTFFFGM